MQVHLKQKYFLFFIIFQRTITSEQAASITVKERKDEVLNFCANNYLGLANNKDLIEAAKKTLDNHGFGLASVRFICGTTDIHRELEQSIADFHHKDDAILYSSCFDANGGLFGALLTDQDAIISDALNHASIIDGVRLCKAKRFRYKHSDMADLEQCLKDSKDCRFRMIATDGVFSMDGDTANLPAICDLADKYDALVFVDESHATGFLGPTGRGTPELKGCMDRVDIINSTLGKGLGGASGGYTTSSQEIIDLLRQTSRPYLFSNTLAPPIVGATIKMFEMLKKDSSLPQKVLANTLHFRERMTKAGFTLHGEENIPIAPVMIGDAALAVKMADMMLEKGIYVIGFSYPVVPKGEARIRVQISAAHTMEQIDRCCDAFIEVGKELGLIH